MDLPTPHDAVNRFATRLFRRDVFNALSEVDFQADDPFKMLLFGSAVVQSHRPEGGYLFRRRAKDLDMGIFDVSRDAMGSGYIANEDVKQIVTQYLQQALDAADARVLGSPANLFDGFDIEKTLSADRIADVMHRRREGHDVPPPTSDVTVQLKVEPIYYSSPMLDPEPMGDKGLYKQNLNEVMGRKLQRAITPKHFTVRDLADFFNVQESGVLDIEANKDVLRSIAIAQIGATTDLHVPKSRDMAKPSDENRARLMETGMREETAQAILESAEKIVDTIFPKQTDRPFDFPEFVRGDLNFSPGELRFLGNIRGIEMTPPNARKLTTPSVQPRLLLEDKDMPEATSSKLMSSIASSHEFEQPLKEARRQREQMSMDSSPTNWDR